jgi:hypothetical protein
MSTRVLYFFDPLQPALNPITNGAVLIHHAARPLNGLVPARHMLLQVLRDRLREPSRDRIPCLPIPLPPGSGETELRREGLDGGAFFDR